MKAAAFAVAAGSLLSAAVASPHDRHMALHRRSFNPEAELIERGEEPSCGCTTYTTTWYGAPTLGQPSPSYTPTTKEQSTVTVYPSPVPTTESSSVYVSPKPTTPSTSAYVPTTPATVPTPYVTTCPTPGTYTMPASTMTITSTVTVPGPHSTTYQPGTYTVPETTVTATTTSEVFTCPYTSYTTAPTPYVTTYTAPGTYTVPGSTMTITSTITVPGPHPTTYPPGTYTAPETTITVTKTNEIFTCPYSSVTPPTHKPTHPKPTETYVPPPSETYAPPPKPTTTYVPPPPETYAPPPKPTTTYVPPPKPTTTHVPPPPETYAPPPKPTETYVPEHPKPHHPKPHHPKPHGPVTNGNQWAMTYTPYGSTGECKSSSEVMSDIAMIKAKGFTTVRLYSTDCDTLPNVGAACSAHGVRILLGIFVDESGIEGSREQLHDISSWGQYDLVDMVVVGNEAVFNSYCSAGELAAYIREVRTTLRAAGCDAPVTTTEPLDVLQESAGELCGAIDVVAANLQPYFNADTTAEKAGEFVAGQLALTKEVCPDLEAYNLECGWPHQGGSNGAAVAGVAEQKQAIRSIIEKAGSNTAVFSFTDDAWKEPGYNGVEPYFGASDCF